MGTDSFSWAKASLTTAVVTAIVFRSRRFLEEDFDDLEDDLELDGLEEAFEVEEESSSFFFREEPALRVSVDLSRLLLCFFFSLPSPSFSSFCDDGRFFVERFEEEDFFLLDPSADFFSLSLDEEESECLE